MCELLLDYLEILFFDFKHSIPAGIQHVKHFDHARNKHMNMKPEGNL